MVHLDAFEAAELYIEQQPILHLIPEKNLKSFVLPAIGALAAEHFVPLVHEVSKFVPPTLDLELEGELFNHGDNVIENPEQFVLPARHTREAEGVYTDGLLLASKSELLKILTGAASPEHHFMYITTFSSASGEEATNYREARARLNSTTRPDIPIFMPRKTVGYRRDGDSRYYSYENWDDRSKDVRVSPAKHSLYTPQELRTLHEIFMTETRIALSGLRTLVEAN